ncbi:MAG: NAD(P)/FAD-dependent oxidoreductase [Acidimicrobiales bacterium]
MNETTNYDAIVIGAGVIGSSVALELSRKGLRTVSVDKLATAGSGSTSSSSSVIRFNYSTAGGVAMAWESLFYWRDWDNHVDLPDEASLIEYVDCGLILLKSEGTNEAAFLPLYDRFNVRCEYLTQERINERFPWIDMNRYGPPRRQDDPEFFADPSGLLEGGFFSPDAGYVNDPMLAAQNLADAAIAAGAEFRFRTEVADIVQTDGRVAGVKLTDGTEIHAPIVVNVAGPHSSFINDLAGVTEGMNIVPKPMRREVHLAPAPRDLDYENDGIMVTDLDVGTYFRPEAGNNVLIGGVEPECDPLEWVEDPDTVSLVPDTEEFELQAMRTARRVIGMGVPSQKRGVIGVYDASQDWTPVYDQSDLPGYYMAIGTSGNQFKNAPTAGRCMAELILAVEAGHDHDADPLVVDGPYTGNPIEMGGFSRRRVFDQSSPTNVLG